MEFDAVIRAVYLSSSIDASLRPSLCSAAELWSLLSEAGQFRDAAMLGFEPHLANCSWDSNQGEVSISFIHGCAPEICQRLLLSLKIIGFDSAEAYLFSDECECIVDENGNVRRVGQRMSFDAQGLIVYSDALDFSD